MRNLFDCRDEFDFIQRSGGSSGGDRSGFSGNSRGGFNSSNRGGHGNFNQGNRGGGFNNNNYRESYGGPPQNVRTTKESGLLNNKFLFYRAILVDIIVIIIMVSIKWVVDLTTQV